MHTYIHSSLLVPVSCTHAGIRKYDKQKDLKKNIEIGKRPTSLKFFFSLSFPLQSIIFRQGVAARVESLTCQVDD